MINVVLYEPEIPQNTGNIMRTCMAANCHLHLIEPLGFSMDEKHLRRSGMDYRKVCDYTIYPNWEDFKNKKGIIEMKDVILYILIFFNIMVSVEIYNEITLHSRLNYEALVCLEDPDCNLELD